MCDDNKKQMSLEDALRLKVVQKMLNEMLRQKLVSKTLFVKLSKRLCDHIGEEYIKHA